MKLSAAICLISVSTASAFTANLQQRQATQLNAQFDVPGFFEAASDFVDSIFSAKKDSGTTVAKKPGRADATALIDEATRLSKEYGPSSPEARLAWEAVEEVNASDNSVASMGNLNEECEVENVSEECLEYSLALDELQELIAANAMPEDKTFVKELASTVKPVKLTPPPVGKAPPSFQLEKALVEARKITSELGLDAPEAKSAWEAVEEIAAAGNDNALGGHMDKENCFVEAAQEACEALEELHKIVADHE